MKLLLSAPGQCLALPRSLGCATVPEAIIALGGNADNPVERVLGSITRLQGLAEGLIDASSLWESEPVAMNDDSGVFINAVVAFQTGLSARDLLIELQKIEVELGRPVDHGKNVARTIDLDILAYGANVIAEPDLEIPHPRMMERLFVLLPLQEIRPEFIVPGQARSLSALIEVAPAIHISRRQ